MLSVPEQEMLITSQGKRRVTRSRVWCEIRGRIDVELCFYCPSLEAIDLDSPVRTITCKPLARLSPDEKVAYERLSVIQLAEALGNVSQACREFGMTRRQFYEFKRRFENEGLSGLMDNSRERKSHPLTTSKDLVQIILQLSLQHPEWGCNRLSDALRCRGVTLSSTTIQHILIRNDMGRRQDRVRKRLDESFTG